MADQGNPSIPGEFSKYLQGRDNSTATATNETPSSYRPDQCRLERTSFSCKNRNFKTNIHELEHWWPVLSRVEMVLLNDKAPSLGMCRPYPFHQIAEALQMPQPCLTRKKAEITTPCLLAQLLTESLLISKARSTPTSPLVTATKSNRPDGRPSPSPIGPGQKQGILPAAIASN